MPRTSRPHNTSTTALLDPERLIRRRVELGLMQKEVAQRANISAQYLADIEAGRRRGSAPVRASLAKALRVNLTELLRKGDAA